MKRESVHYALQAAQHSFSRSIWFCWVVIFFGTVVDFDIWYMGVCLSIRKGVFIAHKTILIIQGVEFFFKLKY